MATKKILCLLIAAAVLFSFAFSVFAEELSLISDTYGFWVVSNGSNALPDYHGPYSSLPSSSDPGDYVFSVDLGGGSGYYKALGMSSTFVEPDPAPYVTHVFQPGYTYSGFFTFVFTFLVASDVSTVDFSSIPLTLSLSDSLQSYLSSANTYTFSNDDLFQLGVSIDLDPDLSTRVYCSFNFAFQFTEGFSFDPTVVSLSADFMSGFLTSSGRGRASFRYYASDIRAIFDPGGESFEDEADKIVQGQKEAAQYALDQEKAENQQAYNEALGDADTSAFDLASFATSFGRLFDGLNYQGTDFHFMFPGSGVVPALNMQLWPETEIPFRQWIDRMPSAWLTIARFLAWFGLAWAFIHKIRALIQDINGGDEE